MSDGSNATPTSTEFNRPDGFIRKRARCHQYHLRVSSGSNPHLLRAFTAPQLPTPPSQEIICRLITKCQKEKCPSVLSRKGIDLMRLSRKT
jgi:hypothetical protein